MAAVSAAGQPCVLVTVDTAGYSSLIGTIVFPRSG